MRAALSPIIFCARASWIWAIGLTTALRHKPGLSISFWNSAALPIGHRHDSRYAKATDVGRVHIVKRLGIGEVVGDGDAQ